MRGCAWGQGSHSSLITLAKLLQPARRVPCTALHEGQAGRQAGTHPAPSAQHPAPGPALSTQHSAPGPAQCPAATQRLTAHPSPLSRSHWCLWKELHVEAANL